MLSLRRLPRLLLVLLLATPLQASAECAWVRWENHWGGTFPEQWTLRQAYTLRAECMAGLAHALALDRKSATKVPSGARVELHDDGARWTLKEHTGGWRYFCLPDTIDPRGPKGSGR